MKNVMLILLVCAISSCASHRQFIYFQTPDGSTPTDQEIENLAAIKIRTNDILAVTVSSLNPDASAPYNLVRLDINSAQAPIRDFLVNAEGYINYPGVGQIHLKGLTIPEAEGKILEAVKPYVSDASVNVRLTNFNITVTGEVTAPSRYGVTGERLTVLEALGMAGDVTDFGDREKVMVIREVEGVREFQELNLLSDQVFKSPFFFLQQNDMIYVPPTKGKAFSARSEPISRTILPVLGVMTSLASLIIVATRR